MSTASRAAASAVVNRDSVQMGDYSVTKDWTYAQNPLRGHGGADYVFFNPTDPTQKFFLDEGQSAYELQQYLDNLSADSKTGNFTERSDSFYGGVNKTSLGQYFTGYADDSFQDLFASPTLAQLAETTRRTSLAQQSSAGQLTEAEATRLANDPGSQITDVGDNVYADAYNAAQTTGGGKTAPTGIESLVLYTPDGAAHTVKKGSKAYNKYISMGATTEQLKAGTTSSGSYTVQPGDTLSQIASSYGVGVNDITGFRSGNPNLIYPGEKLTIGGQVAPTGGSTSGGTTDSAADTTDLTTYEAPIDEMLRKLNIQVEKFTSGTATPNDYMDTYADYLDDQGYNTVAAQFQADNKALEKLSNEKSLKANDINDNPWLDEGTRIKRLQRLDQDYLDRENNLLARLKRGESAMSSITAEARWAVQSAYVQYNEDRSFASEMLFNFMDIAQSAKDAEVLALQQEFENQIALEELDISQFNAQTNRINANKAGETGGLTSSEGFFSAKYEDEVRAALAELKYDRDITDPQELFDALRSRYSPSVVTDEALKQLVGLQSIEAPRGSVDESMYQRTFGGTINQGGYSIINSIADFGARLLKE